MSARPWGRAVVAIGLTPIAVAHLWGWRRESQAGLRFLTARAVPPPPLRCTPRVSILVAAWNEAALIEQHLGSVRALSYPDLEYILCAGGPDGTYELAKQHASCGMVLLEQHPGDGKQGALRRCLPHATGEILFLTDADTLLDEPSFLRTLAPLLNDDEAVASGVSRPLAPDRATFPLVTFLYGLQSYHAAHRSRHVGRLRGCNAAVRRCVVEAARGFDADARTGEDYRLARELIRYGCRIRFVPESAIATVYPSNPLRYARYRSRGMRTAFIHGVATGDWWQVGAASSAVLAGLAILASPLAVLRGGFILRAAWSWMLAFALGRALRQAALGAQLSGGGPSPGFLVWVPAWLVLDCLIWASTPLQLLSRTLRSRW